MSKKKKYRLQILLVVKERTKKKTELELARAIKKLEEEKQKLKKLQDEKKQIERRIREEQGEMRRKVASGHARIKDPQVHLSYIRKLRDDLEEVERRIEDQKDKVRQAEKHLARCRNDYVLAAQDLNMMQKHKELWEKKQQRALNLEENKQMNELGNVIYQINKGK